MRIHPFAALRPAAGFAKHVAALPYDVYSREEAAQAVQGQPLSFLNIDRPETQFGPDHDQYAPDTYARAAEMLQERIDEGVFVHDKTPRLYVYELVMDGRRQTGLVTCCDIDDYINGTIKQHEKTLHAKELDRVRHIDTLSAQTGPIYLAYRDNAIINALIELAQQEQPLYDFVAEDGIAHRVWTVGNPQLIEKFQAAFDAVPAAYIADGHHRAMSAVQVGLARREERPDYAGDEEFNRFLAVMFPAGQLAIMAYNRVVHDLNGLSKEEFISRLTSTFEVIHEQGSPLEPMDKGAVAMYLDGRWYGLGVLPEVENSDPVEGLDVAILQNRVLGPVLGIDDPRTSSRIEFVGGIRGLDELVRRVDARTKDGAYAVAFAMYPASIYELMAVSDAGLCMPPKSTWFEPKLRSGLFIHEI